MWHNLKAIMSYVTYLENDYVVCDIIRVVAAGATDIYWLPKQFWADINRFGGFLGFWGDFEGMEKRPGESESLLLLAIKSDAPLLLGNFSFSL